MKLNNFTVEEIQEIVDNKEFKARLSEIKDLDEATELLGEYGVDVTADELAQCIEAAEGENGELSAEQLDNVSGGFIISACAVVLGLTLAGTAGTMGITRAMYGKEAYQQMHTRAYNAVWG